MSEGAPLFDGLAHTPRQHFALYFYAALLRVLGHVSAHFGSADAAHQHLPFLGGYFNEIAAQGLEGASFPEAYRTWRAGIDAWELRAAGRLPLASLRASAGLSHDDLTLLGQIGLTEEDPRIGFAFDAVQGGGGDRRHATHALLAASWHHDGDTLDARAAARRLEALGLVEPVLPDGSGLRVAPLLWDLVRGGTAAFETGWARYRAAETLPEIDSLVLSEHVRLECRHLQRVLASGAISCVVVRGPKHNGRRTIAAALARAQGKGIVEVGPLDGPRDPRWRVAATLGCMLDAALVTTADPAPSDSFELPDIPHGTAPLFVTLRHGGGVTGPLADRTLTLRIPVPDRPARERLWDAVLDAPGAGLPGIRMTTGNIVRAATLARAGRGHDATTSDAVRSAVRDLDRSGLEALARRIDGGGDWGQLAVPQETREELVTLATRCRHRERLGAGLDGAGRPGPGVRALFKGPSGTGKTLAARMLAGQLGMDLYRVDLASVVNKYIGETEKNLERVFASAEELDIILLLDEGDALLTQRTGVQNANDRYANLETNYLLQRLESYEGILIVTTNAGDRIDAAFQRRMDVVIDFVLPDAAERWAIWQMHLPSEHCVDLEVLHAAAQRCALSGAQIRNAALHAALLALDGSVPVGSAHLEAAVAREYRKQGGMSPLRPRLEARA